MLRVAFMGTPNFALPTLQALLNASDEYDVALVVTQPDRPAGRGLVVHASPVKTLALQAKIPVRQPTRIDSQLRDELKSLRLDAIVVVAYGQILKREILEIPRLGCVNIHASLLPRWRGAAPIQWAILSGDTETGVTAMQMVEGLDAGPILKSKSTPIRPDDTSTSLHDRLSAMGGELIVPTLRGLNDLTVEPLAQDVQRVTYAKKLTKDMEALDCSRPAEELARRIRALQPWPGTSITVETPAGAKRLRILKCGVSSAASLKPGKISIEKGHVYLGTGSSALELLEMQWEGKKSVTPEEFISGWKS